jgi:hypothetical protein
LPPSAVAAARWIELSDATTDRGWTAKRRARTSNASALRAGAGVAPGKPRLHKRVACRERGAIAQPWTLIFGWELGMFVADDFQRSSVCLSQDEVFRTADGPRMARLDKGWA